MPEKDTVDDLQKQAPAIFEQLEILDRTTPVTPCVFAKLSYEQISKINGELTPLISGVLKGPTQRNSDVFWNICSPEDRQRILEKAIKTPDMAHLLKQLYFTERDIPLCLHQPEDDRRELQKVLSQNRAVGASNVWSQLKLEERDRYRDAYGVSIPEEWAELFAPVLKNEVGEAVLQTDAQALPASQRTAPAISSPPFVLTALKAAKNLFNGESYSFHNGVEKVSGYGTPEDGKDFMAAPIFNAYDGNGYSFYPMLVLKQETLQDNVRKTHFFCVQLHPFNSVFNRQEERSLAANNLAVKFHLAIFPVCDDHEPKMVMITTRFKMGDIDTVSQQGVHVHNRISRTGQLIPGKVMSPESRVGMDSDCYNALGMNKQKENRVPGNEAYLRIQARCWEQQEGNFTSFCCASQAVYQDPTTKQREIITTENVVLGPDDYVIFCNNIRAQTAFVSQDVDQENPIFTVDLQAAFSGTQLAPDTWQESFRRYQEHESLSCGTGFEKALVLKTSSNSSQFTPKMRDFYKQLEVQLSPSTSPKIKKAFLDDVVVPRFDAVFDNLNQAFFEYCLIPLKRGIEKYNEENVAKPGSRRLLLKLEALLNLSEILSKKSKTLTLTVLNILTATTLLGGDTSLRALVKTCFGDEAVTYLDALKKEAEKNPSREIEVNVDRLCQTFGRFDSEQCAESKSALAAVGLFSTSRPAETQAPQDAARIPRAF
ncbi:MAG: hypothetical protein NTW08_06345 [Gammaproteobacteria bacterium]|nr:hypothetical protein [Gammaproteobacteria bacterium]